MDRHNTDAIPGLPPRTGETLTGFTQPTQLGDKAKHALMSVGFKPPCILVKQAQMILSGRAALHGTVDRQQAGALIDLPEQAVPGQIHRFGAQCIQFIYKVNAFFLSPLSPRLHALPEIPLWALGTQMGQITAGKAVHRAGEHTEQRHILPGIVHNFKECDRHGHLSLREKISGAVAAPRNAVTVQCPGQVPHDRAGRAV